MKKAAYGLGGLVLLLVAAALIGPGLYDWNTFKPEIAAEVRKATGRTLEIRGDLNLGILPTPHLSVADVRFENAPGATAAHMAALKELRASVKFFPLLTGNIEIASVELIEPVIELEKLPGGKANWNFTPPASTEEGAPASPDASKSGGGTTNRDSFRLDLLRIENGTIVYRDGASGTVERIETLTADLSAGSLAGPFTIDGGLNVRGTPLTVKARVGRFAEKGAVPFDISLGTPKTKARIGLKGTVTDLETAPSVRAKLDGKGDNLGALISALSGDPEQMPLAKPFSVSATIAGSESAVNSSGMTLTLGMSKLTGGIRARLKAPTQIDISLRSDSLNVDEILAVSSKENPVSGQTAAPAAKSSSDVSAANPQAAAKPVSGGLPADIQVNLGVEIAEAIVRNGRVRGIRLAAGLAGGTATLETLTATVPGGGKIDISGRLTSPGGKPAYAGRAAFQTASLRALFDWLEIDVAAVPADRLRRFALSAEIGGTPDEVRITNMAGQLDASRMSGGVTVALRERMAFGASFNIDQFNVDAYTGAAKPASAPKPAPKSSVPDDAPANAPTPAAVPKPEASPLAALKEFDANLALRIGSLNYQKTPIRDVRVDGSLVNGVLTFREASVRNLAGTSARIQGTVTGLDGVPAFNGTVAAASNDLTGLFRVAGIDSSVPPKKLGKMRLTAKTDAARDRVKIDADLQIAGATARLTGAVNGLPAAPAFDLSLDASHPDMAQLAAVFSDGRPGPRTGPITLKTSLKGTEKTMTVSSVAGMTGGNLTIKGKVDTPVTAPRLDIAIDLRQPDMVKFIRAIDPGFTPSNPRLGGLNVSAKLQGTDRDLAIRDLAGNVGPTKISGSGSYIDKAPRPALNLALASSTIPVSDFLEASSGGSSGVRNANTTPGKTGAGTGAPKSTSGRWSTDPIDTAALGLVDANVDLSAEALLYKTFRVDNPKIIAVLKDKVLNVSRVSGTMFDGSFEMKGTVDGRAVPSTTTSLTITKANVGKALFQAAEFDIADGVLSFGLDLAASGKSQAAMINDLNGKGRIDVVNGAVKGFDLKKASDSLNNLKNVAGILGVLGSAMGGGTTRFSSLNGTFDIQKGVMNTRDLKLVADASEGTATGFVDLPKWHMDMLANFRLTEHAGAPPIRVRAVGPPDDPRRIFDFQSLQAWILQQGVGGLIQNLIPGLGGKSPSSQQQQPQQQQQRAPNPGDVLKGILKGLGR